MAIDPKEFRRTVGQFVTGVTVIAADLEGKTRAMTANAFTSLSLDPPLVLFCVAKKAHLGEVIYSVKGFSVNILTIDQQPLSQYFAGGWKEPTPPPFTFEPWEGGPKLAGVSAALGCTIETIHEGGDHFIVVGRVLALLPKRAGRTAARLQCRTLHSAGGDRCMKQPALGITATILVMAIALAFISLFSFPTFAGWVAYFLLCVIPMQIVMIVTWGTGQPAFAGNARQPVKGILLTLICVVIGLLIAAALIPLIGAHVTPPAPILAHWVIVAVPVTFWAAIMWGGWPFTKLIKNPMAAGLAMLVAVYIVNGVLFRIFFNYEFMAGAPVYVASLDPHGMFNGWSALVFYVTALAGMFLMLGFDLWPLTTVGAIMQQPVLGIVWTICALLFAFVAFYIGVTWQHMDVVRFLVRVPVPLIFGSIVVLNMLQNSLAGSLKQPLKGIANVALIIVIGGGLARLYEALMPRVTGALPYGPPTYDFEIWLATALLSTTFPFLMFYNAFFGMWPLAKQTPPETARVSSAH